MPYLGRVARDEIGRRADSPSQVDLNLSMYARVALAAREFETETHIPVRVLSGYEVSGTRRLGGPYIPPEQVRLDNIPWTRGQIEAVRDGHDNEWNAASWGDATRMQEYKEWADQHGYTIILGKHTAQEGHAFNNTDHYVIISEDWFNENTPHNSRCIYENLSFKFIEGRDRVEPQGLPFNLTVDENQTYQPGDNYSFEQNEDGPLIGEVHQRVFMYYPRYLFDPNTATPRRFNWRKMLDDAWDLASGDIDFDAMHEAREQRRRDRERQQLVRIARHQGNQALETVQGEEDRLTREINAARQQISDLEARLQTNSAQMQVLLDQRPITEDEAVERLEASFNEITNNVHTDRYELSSGNLVVHTKPIQMFTPHQHAGLYSREEAWLGPYEIKISLQGRGIVITNTRNSCRGGELAHPHVRGGQMCYGGMGNVFNDLIGQLDYGGVYAMLVEMLTTYNPDDQWGRAARFWLQSGDNDWDAEYQRSFENTEHDNTEGSDA